MKAKSIFLLSILMIISSGVKAQISDSLNSYFYVSIDGNENSGIFNIEITEESPIYHAINMVGPESPGSEYKITKIELMDSENASSMLMKLPAQVGLIELTEKNREKYRFSFIQGDKNFIAHSVSFNILEVKEDNISKISLSRIRGKFEGVMDMTESNSKEITKVTIHGEFQYISPLYQKKLKKRRDRAKKSR